MFGEKSFLDKLNDEVERFDRKVEFGERLTEFEKQKLKDIKDYTDSQKGCGGIIRYMARRIDAINAKDPLFWTGQKIMEAKAK